jgi:hypothetical protein
MKATFASSIHKHEWRADNEQRQDQPNQNCFIEASFPFKESDPGRSREPGRQERPWEA